MLKKLLPICLFITSAYCMEVPTDKWFKVIESKRETDPLTYLKLVLKSKATDRYAKRIKAEKLTHTFESLALRHVEPHDRLRRYFRQTVVEIDAAIREEGAKSLNLERALISCLNKLNKISHIIDPQ